MFGDIGPRGLVLTFDLVKSLGKIPADVACKAFCYNNSASILGKLHADKECKMFQLNNSASVSGKTPACRLLGTLSKEFIIQESIISAIDSSGREGS